MKGKRDKAISRGGFGKSMSKRGKVSFTSALNDVMAKNLDPHSIAEVVDERTARNMHEVLVKLEHGIFVVRDALEIESANQSCPRSLLLDSVMSPENAQDIQANLEDVFGLWCKLHGENRARRIYRSQIILAVGGHWLNKLIGFFERAAKAFRQIGGI